VAQGEGPEFQAFVPGKKEKLLLWLSFLGFSVFLILVTLIATSSSSFFCGAGI
jgi:hypothetical protein